MSFPGRHGGRLNANDALGRLLAEPNDALGKLGRSDWGFVGKKASAQLVELRFEHWIVLTSRGELLFAKRQQLDTLSIERMNELPVPLAGVFEALLVEL